MLSVAKNTLFCPDPNHVESTWKKEMSQGILAGAIIKCTWIWRHEIELGRRANVCK